MNVHIQFLKPDERPSPDCSLAIMLPGPKWETHETHLSFCQNMSRQTNCPIITAPLLLNDFCGLICCTPEAEYRQSVCFPPAGSGIKPGKDITAIDLPFGRIALCCAEDIFQPQYARLAALRGNILMAASCFGPSAPAYRMAGAWSAVQANCLPVALAETQGGMLILPCRLTEDLSGFGKSTFNVAELKTAYDDFPVFDSLNPAFYKRYEEALRKL